MELDEVRRFALGLPETTEEPHFEKASFRVRGKIFVTVPEDGGHLHVLVDEEEARACVAADPAWFEELWWGQRLTGVRVTLAGAPADEVRELVEDAWRRKAPKRVLADFDASRR